MENDVKQYLNETFNEQEKQLDQKDFNKFIKQKTKEAMESSQKFTSSKNYPELVKEVQMEIQNQKKQKSGLVQGKQFQEQTIQDQLENKKKQLEQLQNQLKNIKQEEVLNNQNIHDSNSQTSYDNYSRFTNMTPRKELYDYSQSEHQGFSEDISLHRQSEFSQFRQSEFEKVQSFKDNQEYQQILNFYLKYAQSQHVKIYKEYLQSQIEQFQNNIIENIANKLDQQDTIDYDSEFVNEFENVEQKVFETVESNQANTKNMDMNVCHLGYLIVVKNKHLSNLEKTIKYSPNTNNHSPISHQYSFQNLQNANIHFNETPRNVSPFEERTAGSFM